MPYSFRSGLIFAAERFPLAGGIGQPLALLLKANPLVTEACSFLPIFHVNVHKTKV